MSFLLLFVEHCKRGERTIRNFTRLSEEFSLNDDWRGVHLSVIHFHFWSILNEARQASESVSNAIRSQSFQTTNFVLMSSWSRIYFNYSRSCWNFPKLFHNKLIWDHVRLSHLPWSSSKQRNKYFALIFHACQVSTLIGDLLFIQAHIMMVLQGQWSFKFEAWLNSASWAETC